MNRYKSSSNPLRAKWRNNASNLRKWKIVGREGGNRCSLDQFFSSLGAKKQRGWTEKLSVLEPFATREKKIIAWSENIEFGFMYDRTIVGGTEFLHGGCTFLIYSMRICSVQKTNKALSSLDANNYGALLQNVLEELINYHAYRR